jgi:hypothetical protein
MSVETHRSEAVREQDSALGRADHPYRAVSRLSVAGLACGLLSLGGLATPLLLVPALLSTLLGIVGLSQIRRYPEELTGRVIARVAIVLGICVLLVGSGLHAAIYATEVPEGCVRISFADLQPYADEPKPFPEAPPLPIPYSALELNGKRVFIKGYVYPDGQQAGIKQFILVPDMGTCCFGGQPKLTDMIEVTLRDPLRVEFARRKRKLAGTLRVDYRPKPVNGLGGVFYQLDADYVR